jgi:dienelactone hydrolase
MKGYLVMPANLSGKTGTVIVVHENRGLNAHIKDVARRVATEGFVALAVDYLSPLGAHRPMKRRPGRCSRNLIPPRRRQMALRP